MSKKRSIQPYKNGIKGSIFISLICCGLILWLIFSVQGIALVSRTENIPPPNQEATDMISPNPSNDGLSIDTFLTAHKTDQDPEQLLTAIQEQQSFFLKERQTKQVDPHFTPDVVITRYFKKYYGDKTSLQKK